MGIKFKVPYRNDKGNLAYIEVLANSTKEARNIAITELRESCYEGTVIGGLRQIKILGRE
jgi:hypothetical protein